MKIAGVVILYNPDGNLPERIESYRSVLDALYIIDNNLQSNKNLLHPLISESNVFYFHDGTNQGLSIRLNQAATKCIEDGYDWLLTMDQDSFFEKEALDEYLLSVKNHSNKHQVAMFGIEHDERLVLKKKGFSFKQVTHLITSGSLVNLDLFTAIGGFDEKLFIDHVDQDYCFRSILKGYQIIKFDNIHMQHSIGQASQHRSLKNLKVTPRALHSPVRVYYMTRNYLYIAKLYASTFPKEIMEFRKHLFNRIKNNLLYNKKRQQVLKYIIKGLLHYKAGKMGHL